MTDQSKKDRYREPQEEFIDDGLAENKKASDARPNPPNYEDWALEELHREARMKGVENYMELDRSELIKKLNTAQ